MRVRMSIAFSYKLFTGVLVKGDKAFLPSEKLPTFKKQKRRHRFVKKR